MNTVRFEPVIITSFSTDKDTFQCTTKFAEGFDPETKTTEKIAIVEPTYKRKPKRLSAFIYYTQQRRPQILQGQTFTEKIKDQTTKMMEQEWYAMTEQERQAWKTKANNDFQARMLLYESEKEKLKQKEESKAPKKRRRTTSDEDQDDELFEAVQLEQYTPKRKKLWNKKRSANKNAK